MYVLHYMTFKDLIEEEFAIAVFPTLTDMLSRVGCLFVKIGNSVFYSLIFNMHI